MARSWSRRELLGLFAGAGAGLACQPAARPRLHRVARALPAPLAQLTSPSPVRADRVGWLGGEWFLLGCSFPWYHYNKDFGDSLCCSIAHNQDVIDRQLAGLARYGTKVTRWYIFNDLAAYPRVQGGRVLPLGQQFFDNFDRLLELVGRHGIYLIPVLLDEGSLGQRANRDAKPAVITDAALRQSYLEDVLRPLLQRYGQHPQILAWSVLNEPEYSVPEVNRLDDRIAIPRAVMREFLAECAEQVHRHAGQPAAVESSMRFLNEWRGLGFDLFLGHWYPWMDQYWPDYSPYVRNAASYELERPLVISEFPCQATPYGMLQSLDWFHANGYAGALAWSYANNVDEWANWLGVRDVLRGWATAHVADVAIRPAGAPLAALPALGPTVRPRVLFEWERPGDLEGWSRDWGPTRGLQQSATRLPPLPVANVGRGERGALEVQLALPQRAETTDLGVTCYFGETRNLSWGEDILTAWVYLPPEGPRGLTAQLGCFDAAYTLRSSPETPLVAGQWTRLVWVQAPLRTVRGLVVSASGTNAAYQGSLYVDQLAVQ